MQPRLLPGRPAAARVRVRKLYVSDKVARSVGEGGERSSEGARKPGPPRREDELGLGRGRVRKYQV